MDKLPHSYRRFKEEQRSMWQAYEQLGAAASEAGPLDAKVRQLVKLGMAAAAQSESAVHSHTHRALEAGASTSEVEHALLLGITTIGFPTMMAALSWAKAAIAEHNK